MEGKVKPSIGVHDGAQMSQAIVALCLYSPKWLLNKWPPNDVRFSTIPSAGVELKLLSIIY